MPLSSNLFYYSARLLLVLLFVSQRSGGTKELFAQGHCASQFLVNNK